MKQVWMARDGKLFDNESECAVYERDVYFPQLLTLITDNIVVEYNDDFGSWEITTQAVAVFIKDHIYSIVDILRDGDSFYSSLWYN